MSAHKRILVVGPARLAEMVLAQSLFKVLKQRYPQSELDVVAPTRTLPLIERMPEVDSPIALDVDPGGLALGRHIALGRQLRVRDYDRAIVLTNSFQSATVPYVARARRRTGFGGTLHSGLFNDVRKLDKRTLPDAVDRFVALGLRPNESLPMPLPLPELVANRENTLHALNAVGHAMPQVPVLALCPGSDHGTARRWPIKHFAEIALAKLVQGWEVWLFGSTRDAPVTHAIDKLTGGRCIDLGGRTELAEAIDLLSLAQVVVSNDTSLMHVAAALGRKLIALCDPSDRGHAPPMGDKTLVRWLGREPVEPRQVLAAMQGQRLD